MAKEMTAEQMARKALDYTEVLNTMSRHMYYHAASKNCEELEAIWAKKQPDVRWIIHGNVYEGWEALHYYYCESSKKRHMPGVEQVAKFYPIEVSEKNMGIGGMILHVQDTPVIEIAGDGKTAQGLWYSPGMIAGIGEDGKPHGRWMWEKYGVDFIKEDGVWKLWKIRWVHQYSSRPMDGWVKPEKLSEFRPSAEGEHGLPDWWKVAQPPKGIDYTYPSGYIFPFHFNHPVTGKPTSEEKRNARLKGVTKE